MTSDTAPWASCQVCGHHDHPYTRHLNEVTVPEFVNTSVNRLRKLEMAGTDIHPLVIDVEHLVADEDGGRRAWAIWLLKLLEELEDSSGAPEVVAEIEAFLDGFSR
ncbi:MAG TPA: hypothetical protein VFS66_13490 [Acidimicrobiia bacterium]|nr:hypothetical protein [Acidimicrobiia bacterium]